MGELRLAPARQEDLAVVERLTTDPGAVGEHGWFGWFGSWLHRRRWEEDRLLGDDRGVLVVLRGDEPLGFVSWYQQRTARTSYCWNIGISILPEVRGLGYGTEAQRLLTEYLFAHTQVNRVEAVTEATNTAEQWALQKAGFTREGVLRGYAFRDGRWRDAVVFSMLRSDMADMANTAD